MKIVGCDLHTRYQQIAMLDQETGELIERRLEHESGEARSFYAALSAPVRVGIEATGHTRWFERMLGGWPSLPMARRIVGAPSFAAFCEGWVQTDRTVGPAPSRPRV